MAGQSNIVRFDKVRGMVFSSITASYQAIGFLATPLTPAPLTHAMRVLHFINSTDVDIMVSFDSINDNFPILAGGFSLYDLTSDEDMGEQFRYQVGSNIYIKYLAVPTTGTFYIASVYGLFE